MEEQESIYGAGLKKCAQGCEDFQAILGKGGKEQQEQKFTKPQAHFSAQPLSLSHSWNILLASGVVTHAIACKRSDAAS